jgi:hypothetical protein
MFAVASTAEKASAKGAAGSPVACIEGSKIPSAGGEKPEI